MLLAMLGGVAYWQIGRTLLVTAASTVEAAGYVQQPSVKSTTATSKRSSLIVAAFAGLIVGVILALLWDSFRRPRGAA